MSHSCIRELNQNIPVMAVSLIDAVSRNPSLKYDLADIMNQSIDIMVSNYKKCGCLPASHVSDHVIFE